MLFGEERRKEIGRLVEEHMFKTGISAPQIAAKAGCDAKTVRAVIAGTASESSISLIVQALKIDVSPRGRAETADDQHGSYSKPSFMDEYGGLYASYRWSYDVPRHIIRTVFEVSWAQDASFGSFAENQRYQDAMGRQIDYSQSGEVYANGNASVLHLLTNEKGRLRVITLTKLHPPDMFMRGITLTQSRRNPQPAVTPTVFEKLVAATPDEAAQLVGEMTPSHPDYLYAKALLNEAEHSFVLSTFAQAFGREQATPAMQTSTHSAVELNPT